MNTSSARYLSNIWSEPFIEGIIWFKVFPGISDIRRVAPGAWSGDLMLKLEEV